MTVYETINRTGVTLDRPAIDAEERIVDRRDVGGALWNYVEAWAPIVIDGDKEPEPTPEQWEAINTATTALEIALRHIVIPPALVLVTDLQASLSGVSSCTLNRGKGRGSRVCRRPYARRALAGPRRRAVRLVPRSHPRAR